MRKPTRDTVAGRHLTAWFALRLAARKMAAQEVGRKTGDYFHNEAAKELHEAALRYARSVRP